MISIYWAKRTYCEEKHRSFSVTSEELGLEGNAEKKKCIFMCCQQTAGQSCNIKIANKSCESLAKFKSLGMAPTNENCVLVEITSRLNSGNDCYPSVKNPFVFLFSS
jgi:hypothetical protein